MKFWTVLWNYSIISTFFQVIWRNLTKKWLTFWENMIQFRKRLDFLVYLLWGSSKVEIYHSLHHNVLRHSHGSRYWCVWTVACGANAPVTHRAKVSEQSKGLLAENLACFVLPGENFNFHKRWIIRFILVGRRSDNS